MSDGREEREEAKKRREQYRQEDREDWIDRGERDEVQPERTDSWSYCVTKWGRLQPARRFQPALLLAGLKSCAG
jgi:hypothetical protein